MKQCAGHRRHPHRASWHPAASDLGIADLISRGFLGEAKKDFKYLIFLFFLRAVQALISELSHPIYQSATAALRGRNATTSPNSTQPRGWGRVLLAKGAATKNLSEQTAKQKLSR